MSALFFNDTKRKHTTHLMDIIVIRLRELLGELTLRVYNVVFIACEEESDNDLDLELRNLHATAGMAPYQPYRNVSKKQSPRKES